METEVFMGHLGEFANSLLGCIRRFVASRLIEVNPFLSTGEESAGFSSGLPSMGKTWTYWNKFSAGAQRWPWDWHIFCVRKSERAGTTECGEGKAQRGLICVYKSWL